MHRTKALVFGTLLMSSQAALADAVVVPDEGVQYQVHGQSKRLNEPEMQAYFQALARYWQLPQGVQLKPLQLALPTYPRKLRALAIEGRVLVSFKISESGQLEQVQVVSSPHAELSNSVLTALSQWRFTPLPQGSAYQGQFLAIPFEFKLED